MSESSYRLITDFLHPSNPIFRNKYLLGNQLLGPGDPSCSLCKGIGIVCGLKCNCQDNYLVQLINYAEDNNLTLVQYYGKQLSNYSDKQLDEIFREKQS